jgi:hypothetical protein
MGCRVCGSPFMPPGASHPCRTIAILAIARTLWEWLAGYASRMAQIPVGCSLVIPNVAGG